jgi:hypothetical protein
MQVAGNMQSMNPGAAQFNPVTGGPVPYAKVATLGSKQGGALTAAQQAQQQQAQQQRNMYPGSTSGSDLSPPTGPPSSYRAAAMAVSGLSVHGMHGSLGMGGPAQHAQHAAGALGTGMNGHVGTSDTSMPSASLTQLAATAAVANGGADSRMFGGGTATGMGQHVPTTRSFTSPLPSTKVRAHLVWLFHLKQCSFHSSRYSLPPTPTTPSLLLQRMDPLASMESPGLDDFAHMGLITDLLE